MGHTNLITKGKLVGVSDAKFSERDSTLGLIFPEETYSSIINIQKDSDSHSTEVFGLVPLNYIGKNVELRQDCYEFDDKKLFIQELYVEGRIIINKAVFKKE